MKKQCIRFVEWLRDTWRSLGRTGGRGHDPLLVNSMASFNFDGVWSLDRRRHRARRKPTWNRRAEPNKFARVRDFFVRPERKQQESASRPILTKGGLARDPRGVE